MIEGAKIILDFLHEVTLRFSATFGAQVLPEDRVIDVTSTVKLQGWLEIDN